MFRRRHKRDMSDLHSDRKIDTFETALAFLQSDLPWLANEKGNSHQRTESPEIHVHLVPVTNANALNKLQSRPSSSTWSSIGVVVEEKMAIRPWTEQRCNNNVKGRAGEFGPGEQWVVIKG